MRTIAALPNLLTLANAFCGLLAISKGIDALAVSVENPSLFYVKLDAACWLVFLGMVFDALDGKVARFTGGGSDFGAQLDSFSDALTFGCAPALLTKVLLEHEGPLLDVPGNPRLHFLAAAGFALMAILRLARFNLETDRSEKAHRLFKGLPSPGAAGAVVSSILFYLTTSRPEQVEVDEGSPTPIGQALAIFPEWQVEVPAWFLPALPLYLPFLGLLMVSRIHYVHVMSLVTRRKSFYGFVGLVFGAFLFFAAPTPMLFVAFNAFVLLGLARHVVKERRARRALARGMRGAGREPPSAPARREEGL
jgi:CDP-diacylglycerol--serine O-phosphatidyltransferase